jgi:autotransporter-associated beta strand protein
MNLVLTNSTNATFGNILGISKNDGGVWVLNPATQNTFTGRIDVNGGQLGLTTNGLGVASALRLANGSVFGFGGDLVITRPITLANNAASNFSGSNNITFGSVGTPITVTQEAGNNAITFSNNLDAGKVLTAYATLASLKAEAQSLNVRGAGSTVWVGAIQNGTLATTINIEIDTNASFTMSGAQNTYAGDTILTQGTLILDKATAFGASRRIQMNGGLLIIRCNAVGCSP